MMIPFKLFEGCCIFHNAFKLMIVLSIFSFVSTLENKYSQEANVNLVNIKDPLRMGKLNLLWEKARMRLSEPKLKKLISELKIQDQEELTFKKLKSSGGDKHGLKEAELRKKLMDIVSRFSLETPHAGKVDPHEAKNVEKAMFNDKKLNKLWEKAEKTGLTQPELKTLKEEFQHHQDKINEYHMLIANTVETPGVEKDTLLNDVTQDFDNMEATADEYRENVNKIKTKHQDLKLSIDSLHKMVSGVSPGGEFTNPKVTGLWKMALRADFDEAELDSLYEELKHYEGRLLKLDFLENEMTKMRLDRIEDEDLSIDDREKLSSAGDTEGKRILTDRLAKNRKKIDKIHDNLEMKIVKRHSEF